MASLTETDKKLPRTGCARMRRKREPVLTGLVAHW
jgi:hypothetical protein